MIIYIIICPVITYSTQYNKRAHPHDTSIAPKITERLFDVYKLTVEWSSDAIVDGAYKS